MSVLSKFRKNFSTPIWNGLFTLLFKGLSKRVNGSNSASLLFYTIIYGLYQGVNLDFGSILWTQLIQSTVSSTRHTKISCAHFWSVIVKRFLDHYKVHFDERLCYGCHSNLADFFIHDAGSKKFSFIGAIFVVMLEKVPVDNAIVAEYRKLPSSGTRPITEEFQKILEELIKRKRGGKRKAKARDDEEPPTTKG